MPLVVIVLFLLIRAVYVGPLVAVKLFPRPDLSFHVVTDDPDRTTAFESAASNHTIHPGICVGANPTYISVGDATIDIVRTEELYSQKHPKPQA